MQLQEILDQLAGNELSQISIGKQDAGVINNVNRERVVMNINMALTALHKRFSLREGRLTVHLSPGTMVYKLDRKRVGRNDLHRDVRYIEETKQFSMMDGLMKVLRVYNSQGVELSLNDLDDPFSLRTPRYDVLEVPDAMVLQWPNLPENLKTNSLDVRYRANHPKLGKWDGSVFHDACTCSSGDLVGIEVDLPDAYLEPLVMWVASRFHNPVGMANEFHAGNSYYAKYEAACQRIETEGMQVDQGSQNYDFRKRGWA